MKRTVAFFFALCLAGSSWAQEWAWEAGQQSHNGSIAVQSASGGTTHALPQNPLAAVAKADQSAVTQPPTIIVQSTGGNAPFNYRDDCYVVDLTSPGYTGWWLIGAGKIEGGNLFSGILGSAYSGQPSGNIVISALLNIGGPTIRPRWCAADVSCAWTTTANSSAEVAMVKQMPVNSFRKCWP